MEYVAVTLMAVVTAVALLAGAASLHVLRRLGALRERMPALPDGPPVQFSGPPLGPVAAAHELIDDRGRRHDLSGAVAEPQLVIALNEVCPSCRDLLAGLREELEFVGFAGTVILCFDSLPPDLAALRRDLGLDDHAIVQDPELFRRWMIGLVPYAVYVGGEEGIVLSGTVSRFGGLRGLLKAIADYRSRRGSAQRAIEREAGVAHA